MVVLFIFPIDFIDMLYVVLSVFRRKGSSTIFSTSLSLILQNTHFHKVEILLIIIIIKVVD